MDGRKTIKEAFAYYIDSEIVVGGLSKKTQETYFYASKLVVAFFGDVLLSSLRLEDVRDFYKHLLTWQKPDSARANLICLRAVIRLFKNLGEPVMDPSLIKTPKREKRLIQYLTNHEMIEFIAVVGQKRRGYAEINRLRNKAIIELLYATGMRVGELCSLNRNSIKDRQFTIIGKSKNPRICFITEHVENSINEYLNLREDNERALFISNQTKNRITPSNIREVFKNACARSDFKGVHPHTIRHSFATYLLSREVDLRYISALMGHESLDTTKIYTHYSNPKLKTVYENAMSKH